MLKLSEDEVGKLLESSVYRSGSKCKLLFTTESADCGFERTDYSQVKIMLFEIEYGESYIVLESYHCSCTDDFEHWEGIAYTREEVGKLPLDQNLAEQEIKKFVEGWIGHD